MKWFQVTMPNGERWVVPISVIAQDRAKYYADRDAEKDSLSKEERDKVYEEELAFALEDELEIYDWAPNNMNWTDVLEHALRIGLTQMTDRDYQEGWLNGEKKIISFDNQSFDKTTNEEVE